MSRHLEDGDVTLASLVLGSDTSVYQRVFQPRAAVTTFHDSGRFGYSRDVTDIFGDEGGEGFQDYILGLVILGGLVYVFFMIWACYLLLWKCLGKNRVGLFATGNPYPYRDRAALIGRLTFLFSAIIVIIFSLLIGRLGTHQVKDVTGSISNTMVRLEEIQDGIQSVLDKIESDASIVFPLREQVVALLEEDACEVIPTLDEDGLVYVDEDGNPITVQDVLEIPDEVVAELEAVKDDVLDEITSVGNTITSVLNFTEGVQDSMKDVEDNAAKSKVVMLAYSIPAALFIIVLIVGWRDGKYYPTLYCLVSGVLLPLFVFLLFISSAACMGAIAASQGTADVCSGGYSNSPDGTIQTLLNDGEIEFDDTLGGQIANFYIRQCKTSSIPVDFAWDIRVQLTEANDQINLILAQVQDPPEDLPEGCNVDADTLLAAVENLQNYILGIVDNIDETLEWISCPQIVPLLTSMLYDTACDDAMGTIAGLGAYLFVITFFGMMMVTFRSAYYPIAAYHVYERQKQEEKEEADRARAMTQNPYYNNLGPNVDGPDIVLVPKQEYDIENGEEESSDEDESQSSSDNDSDEETEDWIDEEGSDDGTDDGADDSAEDDVLVDTADENDHYGIVAKDKDDEDDESESSEEDDESKSSQEENQPFSDEVHDEEEEEFLPQQGIQPAPEKKGWFFFRK
eukprot:Nitzschia sp. Nitz4//scaffold120_size68122//6396//8581//NITZ4_006036-RA/size68122-augustus-gene-0.91-mRNA-1//1//CDS//3329534254//6481//frame0